MNSRITKSTFVFAIFACLFLLGCVEQPTPNNQNLATNKEVENDIETFFNPSKEVCNKYNGLFFDKSKEKTCKATVNDGKDICAEYKAELTPISYFEKFAIECKKSNNYRKCMKANGIDISMNYIIGADNEYGIFNLDTLQLRAESKGIVSCLKSAKISKQFDTKVKGFDTEQLKGVADDSVVIKHLDLLTNLPLMLNITQYHKERKIFPNSDNSIVYKYAISIKETPPSNEFEKKRTENEVSNKLATVMQKEKTVQKLAIPIIETDVFFEIDDSMYKNGCYKSHPVYESTEEIFTKIVWGHWNYQGKTRETNYLDISIPSQQSHMDLEGRAMICVGEQDAEKLFNNAIPYKGTNTTHEAKGYRGKAYYQLLNLDNGLKADFTKGLKTSGTAMMVAFKIFDKNGNTIFKSNKTWWNRGMRQDGPVDNKINFQY